MSNRLNYSLFCFLSKLFPKKLIKKYPEKPVFIVGSQRSGTTILEKIIAQSNEVCDWSEANYIWNEHFYNFFSNNLKKTIPDFRGRGIHAYEIPKKGWSYSEEKVKRLFGVYCFIHRKSRILHKSPFNTLRLQLLKKFFPECKIINVARDVRAVVRSNIEKTYEGVIPKKDFIDEIIYRWRECIKRVKDFKEKNPHKIVEISYEQLSSNGNEETIEKIFDFCELKINDSVYNKLSEVENRNYKFKQDLTESEIEYIEKNVENFRPKPFGFS
ncbi:MAG: sulfotransferase [Candidatus Magasanikbacteria bacterium]